MAIWQAIIRAHERSQVYGNLLRDVRGIIFMGVPHRGADLAYWATFTANILQFGQLGLGTNPRFVEVLKRSSPTFANISGQTVERAARLSIRTFYETEKMGNQLVRTSINFVLSVTYLSNRQIVDKDSAVLNLPNERAVGVAQANHRTICKFERVDSQKYVQVWHAIRALCQEALSEDQGTRSSSYESRGR
jgi:hypothetical protein